MTCCTKSSIVNMDHEDMTNKMCLSCGAHWYGPANSVQEFTRKEWDAWVETAFDEVAE